VPRHPDRAGEGCAARDRLKCAGGEHRCSGRLGCRVHWVAAADWNATVTRRLGDLLKVARERTRRKHGRHARVEVLGYVCEAQQRGVFPVYVSPVLTKLTGVTMGFLRFRRWIWYAWGEGVKHRDMLVAYAAHRCWAPSRCELESPNRGSAFLLAAS
jgi:hypothetical protein